MRQLNALRLNGGFSLPAFEAGTGLQAEAIGPERAQAQACGWLAVNGGAVTPSDLGRRFTNDLTTLFLTHQNT